MYFPPLVEDTYRTGPRICDHCTVASTARNCWMCGRFTRKQSNATRTIPCGAGRAPTYDN